MNLQHIRTIRDVEEALQNVGFHELRVNGSHRTFGHDDGRRIMVPARSSNIEASGVAFRNLLRDLKRVLSGHRIMRGGMVVNG